MAWATAGFFPGVGTLEALGTESPPAESRSGALVRVGAKPPEADDMF